MDGDASITFSEAWEEISQDGWKEGGFSRITRDEGWDG